MANGNLIDEMRALAASDKIDPETRDRLILAGMADLFERTDQQRILNEETNEAIVGLQATTRALAKRDLLAIGAIVLSAVAALIFGK